MDTVSHFEEHEQDIRRDFWTTLKRFAGQVPFVEDLVAAYYCALDPRRLCGCAVSCSRHSPTSSFDGAINH